MKKLTFQEAHTILKDKKGAGKAKHSKIHLEMDFELDSGIDFMRVAMEMLPLMINSVMKRESDFAGFTAKNLKITDKSYVETELETNPDWPNL